MCQSPYRGSYDVSISVRRVKSQEDTDTSTFLSGSCSYGMPLATTLVFIFTCCYRCLQSPTIVLYGTKQSAKRICRASHCPYATRKLSNLPPSISLRPLPYTCKFSTPLSTLRGSPLNHPQTSPKPSKTYPLTSFTTDENIHMILMTTESTSKPEQVYNLDWI